MSDTPKFEIIEKEDRKELNFEFDYPATAEELWQLLTTKEGLERWFPERAEVTPGVGGSIAFVWGKRDSWADEITVWEPGKRLKLESRKDPKTGLHDPDNHFTFDFTIMTIGKACRLRLVQHGFLGKRDWSDEIDSFSHGWMHQFYSLQNYLAHHRGEQRHFRRIELKRTMTRQECWDRVVGKSGILRPVENRIDPGCKVEFGSGPAMAIGTVVASTPGRQIMLHLPERNDTFLGFGVWKTGEEAWAVIDANFYRASAEQCDMVAGMLQKEMEGAL